MSVCAACGTENPSGFAFCGRCGSPPAAANDLEAAREERKVVTILFCDLVGFTSFSDGADPEDVRATLGPYHAAVRREIGRYGGTLEKFIGDAVMAVYGAPVAHEDDAERAVRSGLRILEAIGDLNADAELGLSVRIGITTGDAVVSLGARPERGEAIVAGDVVNTASRLQGVAPVGGIAVGEATYRATAGIFEYRELAPAVVKGKDAPIPIWQPTAATARFGVDVQRGQAATFIGREDELELLRRTYARAVREPSVQLVTIVGEPGVGKTRLVRELLTFVDDQPELVTWRQGRCLPYGDGITFWALGEIVKAEGGILESDSPEQAGDKLGATLERLADAADRDWLRLRLAPLVGAPLPETAGTLDQEEAFTAWRRFLEALAVRGPLVTVIDDLHWADQGMLDFVDHLVDWASDVPLLIVCSARPELYERRPGWGGGKRNSTTIALSPLRAGEIGQLLQALTEPGSMSAQTQEALIDRSGGNPLYAEEFVRMLNDRELLPTAEVDVPIPETIQALIAARLDTLSAERKGLLQDAAVVGRAFWADALTFIGDRDARTVRDGLHELSQKELVRPSRTSSVRDQAEFTFWHALVSDVAYAQIPRAARARKHRAAAQWIEQLAGERVADHAELLAHHYTRALELLRAAGRDADLPAVTASARRVLEVAGDRASRLDARKAASLFEQALALAPARDADRARLLVKAAGPGFAHGAADEAQAQCEEAIEISREIGEDLGLAGAMLAYFDLLRDRGDTARARAVVTEAVDLLEREAPGPLLARGCFLMSRDHMMSSRFEEGRAWADRALDLTDQFDLPEVWVRSMQQRGLCRFWMGDPAGIDDVRAALERGLEIGLSSETSIAYNNLAVITWTMHGPRVSREIVVEGIEFAERRGQTFDAMWLRAALAESEFHLGAWDAAVRLVDQVAEWDRTAGETYPGTSAIILLATIRAYRGELDAAGALVEELLARARSIADPQLLVPALTAAAHVEHLRGRSRDAVSLAREAVAAAGPKGEALVEALPILARLLTETGEMELAEQLLQTVDPSGLMSPLYRASAAAALAEARGDLQAALTLYAEVAGGWSARGNVLEHGMALLGEGRCLHRLGSSSDAAARFRAAREVFASLRATPLVEETDGWLSPA